jgi:hypothetical protein
VRVCSFVLRPLVSLAFRNTNATHTEDGIVCHGGGGSGGAALTAGGTEDDSLAASELNDSPATAASTPLTTASLPALNSSAMLGKLSKNSRSCGAGTSHEV